MNPVEDRVEGRGFARSREMAACLRSELLYSEKRARDTLFLVIEEILADQERSGEQRIVSQVAREAAARAQAQMPPGADPVRWDVASKTVIKAMIGAGALLRPDGRPVPAGITAQATPVAGLRNGFRDLTEAFLLEVVDRAPGRRRRPRSSRARPRPVPSVRSRDTGRRSRGSRGRPAGAACRSSRAAGRSLRRARRARRLVPVHVRFTLLRFHAGRCVVPATPSFPATLAFPLSRVMPFVRALPARDGH